MQINETIFRDAGSTAVALDSEIWLANTGTVHTHPVVPDWSRACWRFASLISRSAHHLLSSLHLLIAILSLLSLVCLCLSFLSLSLYFFFFPFLQFVLFFLERGIESVTEIANRPVILGVVAISLGISILRKLGKDCKNIYIRNSNCRHFKLICIISSEKKFTGNKILDVFEICLKKIRESF